MASWRARWSALSLAARDRWLLAFVCGGYVALSVLWILRYRRSQPFDIDESGYLLFSVNDWHALTDGGPVGWVRQIVAPNPHSPLTPALGSLVLAAVTSSNNIDLVPTPAGVTANSTVAQIVADAKANATVLGSVQLGEITADFNRAFQPTPTGTAENRGGESTLGNLIADVQLWATQDNGSQIAFMNPGGIRTDLKYAAVPGRAGDADGVVTYEESVVVQPFANTLMVMDMRGAAIKTVLEDQWQPANAARPYLKLGISEGFYYEYDPTASVDNRITGMWLNGEPIDLNATYKVTANSFLASGTGDNFFGFAQATNKVDSGRVDLQAFVDYFAQNSPVAPDYVQRAVGVHVTPPASGSVYAYGETVTVNLSSLAFTTTEPKPTVATATVDGVQVGTAPVDSAIVDNLDTQGRATVTFTIDDAFYGAGAQAQTVTVTIAGDGFSVDVPVAIAAKPGAANITVAPARVSSGGTVDVVLGGFAAGETVSVRLAALGGGTVSTVPVAIGSNGSGTVTLAVPAGTPDGSYQVVATGSATVAAPLAIGTSKVYLFYLNDAWSGQANVTFDYGSPTDVAIAGDWNGDGVDTIMLQRQDWFFVRNTNTTGAADFSFSYGNPGDVVLWGDWDGNGTDTPMVRRDDWFYVKNDLSSGPADYVFSYGNPGDVILVSDWDGDGKDTLAVRRDDWFYIKNDTSSGVADYSFNYGNPGDIVLVGDWDGDGKDTLAVQRGTTFYVRNSTTSGVADIVQGYGNPGDIVLVGDWNGDGTDTLGVHRK